MLKKIVVTGLSLILLGSCSGNNSRFNSDDKELLSLVSPESEIVMGIHFQAVKDSPIFKEYFEEILA